MKIHENFMRKCLVLAKKGQGKTSPNPMVGCIIVHNKKIIGQGYHMAYGSSHAEVNAINSVKDKSLLTSSTLYVNLEPCAHFGKTPPCSDLIIKNKIPKVVIGCVDSFAKVSGKGIQKMINNNIEVKVGVLEKESTHLNRRFFLFHKKRRPYIILKWARSKDNFIAPSLQKEKFWMTSQESKKLVHQWRSYEDAILVGRKTVEADNPLLTVRETKGINPLRVIIDNQLNLSTELNVFNNDAKTIVFNTIHTKKNRSYNLVKINFNNLINNVLKFLYKQEVQSIIVEGGAYTLNSFISENIWDEARVFTTKKILISGIEAPEINLNPINTETIKEDILETFLND